MNGVIQACAAGSGKLVSLYRTSQGKPLQTHRKVSLRAAGAVFLQRSPKITTVEGGKNLALQLNVRKEWLLR
jgi:hypothetical protein